MVKKSKKRSLDRKLEGPFFHYIGETSRSAYERGQEHLKDLEFKRPKSHYLRHAVEFHSNVPPESLKFKMKVLSSHRTSFERQIREAVLIDYYSGPMLMNSKLEYTRCSLPKMSINMGNKQKDEDPMITKEKSTIEKIKLLYKKENKRPMNNKETMVIERKKMRLELPDLPESEVICPNLERNLSPAVKTKKVQRKTVSLKTNQLKLRKCPEVSPLKPERNQKSPKIGAQKRSPTPKLDAEKVSPVPKRGTKMGSPGKELSSKERSTVNEGKIVQQKVNESCIPGMISSPSLKPVRIQRIIEKFEDNVKEGAEKSKVKNAFEALMVSRGDTLPKTPKRKLKRITVQNSTGKEVSLLEKWLRK